MEHGLEVRLESIPMTFEAIPLEFVFDAGVGDAEADEGVGAFQFQHVDG